MREVLQKLARGVIVSVQASQGEPLDKPEYLCALAESVLLGGACAVRMAQVRNIQYFKDRYPDIPVIGITKPEKIPENAHELVYITPGMSDIELLAPCCDIIAMDATLRPRPGGGYLPAIISVVKAHYPNVALMADISTLEEGIQAEDMGFNVIGTTLSGYTSESMGSKQVGPDFGLLESLVKSVQVPVILEGRIWEPAEVTRAFELGAHAVVIGSAVTRPHEITRRFVQAAQ